MSTQAAMTLGTRPKVTVYIPCHNYGRYLGEAIESVIQQTLEDWELIVINDGSSDETAAVARKYVASCPGKIRLISHRRPQELRRCANSALRAARGEYIVRLDADDFLDESALLVLASYLDCHRDVALVYPNWTYVAEDGAFLGTERRKKIGVEASVLDLPPHGACTMVRKRVLKVVGGYDAQYHAQDGHELWLKVLYRFKVANVATPLFFYRQHSESLSRDEARLLEARRRIKEAIAGQQSNGVRPTVVAVIPAKNTYPNLPNVALSPLVGKPLIDYTLDAANEAQRFDLCYVYTDDPRVIEHCSKMPHVLAEQRPTELSAPRVGWAELLVAAVERLEQSHGVFPDIVALLNVHTPLRRAEHIREALDTLLVYDVDSVVSMYEDLDLHFVHSKEGMRPLNPGMIRKVRFEREALYVDNAAIHVFWRDCLPKSGLFEGRVGHFVMPRHLSYGIKSVVDLLVVESMLAREARQPQSGGGNHADV